MLQFLAIARNSQQGSNRAEIHLHASLQCNNACYANCAWPLRALARNYNRSYKTFGRRRPGLARMKFDMFYEVQSAKPWPANHEQLLYRQTIEQARLADKSGFVTWWQVEHNATPEFSYSSAPDLWLAAV